MDGSAQDTLDRWLPAFLAGRRGDRELYVDAPVTWHAASGTETPIDPSVDDPSFARLKALVPDLHRDGVRTEVFRSGFVVQASVAGTVDGATVRVATCLVVRLDAGGRIARFEEYADTAAAAPFVRLLQASVEVQSS